MVALQMRHDIVHALAIARTIERLKEKGVIIERLAEDDGDE